MQCSYWKKQLFCLTASFLFLLCQLNYRDHPSNTNENYLLINISTWVYDCRGIGHVDSVVWTSSPDSDTTRFVWKRTMTFDNN